MKHPMQPIDMVDGVARFRRNEIICWLFDEGRFDLNQLARMGVRFSPDDHMQIAMLLGYSVAGVGELSYFDPEVVARADETVNSMIKQEEWRIARAKKCAEIGWDDEKGCYMIVVGQIWQEDDKRATRYVKVVAVPSSRTVQVRTCDIDGNFTKGSRVTEPDQKRFGMRGGYKLVKGVEQVG